MINLIYEKGEFRFEKAFESVTPQTMDVFLTVKDVVPDTQQPDLTQQACLFINKKLGTEYSTEGLGDFSKTEEKTIVSITEINFRLYQIVICIVYQHITYPYIKNSSTNSNLVDYAI